MPKGTPGSTPVCSIEGCDTLALAREWCPKHYYRWSRHGDPLRGCLTVEERFWPKVNKTDTCWLWTRALADGYGKFKVDGQVVSAHCYAYELLVGPVPEGLELDHMCHNEDLTCLGGDSCPHRACCNPAHLIPSTRRENTLRSTLTGPGINSRKTHCPAGHPYDEENTRVRKRGSRECRTCDRLRARKVRVLAGLAR